MFKNLLTIPQGERAINKSLSIGFNFFTLYIYINVSQ